MKVLIPTSATLFPETKSVEDCALEDYQVGDEVQWRHAELKMGEIYGEGPFRVLAIFRHNCGSHVGVVVGKLIHGHWMVYNEHKRCYQIPAETTPDGKWHFWMDGPPIFDSTYFMVLEHN